MKIRSLAAAIALSLAVGTIPSQSVGIGAVSPPTYKRYSSCAKLHKAYPRGIAHPSARVARGSKYVWDKHPQGRKFKYRPSLISASAYNKQSRVRDRDKDKIACEIT
jgi:hypothetical protein